MRTLIVLTCATALLTGCGAGVPISVRIDEFDFELDLDEVTEVLIEELTGSGVLPPGVTELPEVWPASLPDINYETTFEIPPVVVDLTPEEGDENFDVYLVGLETEQGQGQADFVVKIPGSGQSLILLRNYRGRHLPGRRFSV